MLTEETITNAELNATSAQPNGAPRGAAPARRRFAEGSRWLFVHTTLESLRIAGGSLRANKLRTLLTLVGIVVGVAAVIAAAAGLNGLGEAATLAFAPAGETALPGDTASHSALAA